MTGDAGEPDPRPSEGSDDDEGADTTDPNRRHWLTNDGLAWLLVASMPVIIGLAGGDSLTLQTVPDVMLVMYSLAFGVAVAWAFGKDAVEAWRQGGEA